MRRNVIACLIVLLIIPLTLSSKSKDSGDKGGKGDKGNKFIILHLSDIHLMSPDKFGDNVDEKNRQKEIIEALLASTGKDKIKPDIVIVSGDVVNGKDNRCETYEWIKKTVFDKLVEKIDTVDANEFFVVPGNHDLMRNNIDLKLLLNNRENVHKYMWEAQFLLYKQLAHKSYRQRLLKGMHNYSMCLEAKYNHFLHGKDDEPGDIPLIPFVNIVKDGKKQIALIGLNSSYFSKESPDMSLAALGEYQVEMAYETLKQRAKKEKIKRFDLVVNVFHHPLDQLWQQDLWQINEKKFFDNSILLTGHLHRVRQVVYSESFSNNEICQFQGGSVYLAKSRKVLETLRYQYITVDWAKNKIIVDFRTYDEKKKKWIPDGKKKFPGIPSPLPVEKMPPVSK